MATTSAQGPALRHPVPARSFEVPVLENGDRLPAAEFLRRFNTMPALKKAELIQGIVYMPSPVRALQHGDPDSLVQGWLCNYAIGTPGVKSSSNTTVRLGPEDVAQPDGLLRLVQPPDGRCRVDESGLLVGPPELVVEVAASSVSMDVNVKKTTYLRAGVREYIVWRTQDGALDWFKFENDEYLPLLADEDGLHRSAVLPGLWLDVPALLAQDGARVMEALKEGLSAPEHGKFVNQLRRSTPEGG